MKSLNLKKKISLIKDGIDQKYVKEPLAKLWKKMEQKTSSLA